MIMITTYTLNSGMTKDQTRELMEVFATVGNAPGTTAHYVNADGGGGVVISESDDIDAAYKNILNYAQWMTFDMQVVLPVEEAVPHITEFLG